MQQSFDLQSEADTQALAQTIAAILIVGDVIALHGDLGAGKTTFSKALIRHLLSDPDMDVPSPTFTLVQTYDGPNFPIWHFDMYRIEDPSEIEELGFEETIDGLAIIEWPSKMGDELPKERLDIVIEFLSDARRATLHAHGDNWTTRLALLND